MVLWKWTSVFAMEVGWGLEGTFFKYLCCCCNDVGVEFLNSYLFFALMFEWTSFFAMKKSRQDFLFCNEKQSLFCNGGLLWTYNLTCINMINKNVSWCGFVFCCLSHSVGLGLHFYFFVLTACVIIVNLFSSRCILTVPRMIYMYKCCRPQK